MCFSLTAKSSSRSLPSPNGAYIAIVLRSKLCVRETRCLEIIREMSLPSELVVSWFSWSLSSNRILIGSTDMLLIFSVTNSQELASITNPTSCLTKASLVVFGSKDYELLIFYEFGLRLSIINLITSNVIDIPSIKLYGPTNATRGFSYRPGTSDLSLLTRSGGKDIISLHTADTFDVFKSWFPGTIDAQGMNWSPDGKWLVVCESASHGPKMLIYTADGQLFKTWQANVGSGIGIRLSQWSPNGVQIAFTNYSQTVNIINMPSFTPNFKLVHTAAVNVTRSCSVTKELYIPRSSIGSDELKIGVNSMSFDKSGSLLATKIEESSTTVWIWDLITCMLRDVFVLQATVAKILWHPTIDRQLMVLCEGEEARRFVYFWHPLWSAPHIFDFAAHLSEGRVLGRTVTRWIQTESLNPTLFFSDSQECVLIRFRAMDDSSGIAEDSLQTHAWHLSKSRYLSGCSGSRQTASQ
ncbi:putative WD repeat-containing protein C32H8.09 [Golovinomyces cichoracearum]|uniref:Putative WD repeat-containing protein C32H8.09 n=1 Tax=Golovinomyces cichoracearum TaxID=62708 RepID=A0A420J4G3_9PEZI|nr:putative WD repeat-containing protein C32H8.09 [Golovinomyces cichoracearum]